MLTPLVLLAKAATRLAASGDVKADDSPKHAKRCKNGITTFILLVLLCCTLEKCELVTSFCRRAEVNHTTLDGEAMSWFATKIKQQFLVALKFNYYVARRKGESRLSFLVWWLDALWWKLRAWPFLFDAEVRGGNIWRGADEAKKVSNVSVGRPSCVGCLLLMALTEPRILVCGRHLRT